MYTYTYTYTYMYMYIYIYISIASRGFWSSRYITCICSSCLVVVASATYCIVFTIVQMFEVKARRKFSAQLCLRHDVVQLYKRIVTHRHKVKILPGTKLLLSNHSKCQMSQDTPLKLIPSLFMT